MFHHLIHPLDSKDIVRIKYGYSKGIETCVFIIYSEKLRTHVVISRYEIILESFYTVSSPIEFIVDNFSSSLFLILLRRAFNLHDES